MVLIFDYDGTIHNTKCLYGNAVRKTLKHLASEGHVEYRDYSDEYLSKYLGFAPMQMWDDFMPTLPEDIKKAASSEVGEEMMHGIFSGKAQLYDGIENVLDTLKKRGCTLVILSNCKSEYLEAHREYFDLDRWFDSYFAAEDYGYIPKYEIFEYIKKKYPYDEFVSIGDRASDFEAGIKNGFTTIGCEYGFGTKEELSQCDTTVKSVWEIVMLFE